MKVNWEHMTIVLALIVCVAGTIYICVMPEKNFDRSPTERVAHGGTGIRL